MATVTGYTAERMKKIEDDSIIDGVVAGNNLILTRHDGRTINAGNVKGPQGATGPSGGISQGVLDNAIAHERSQYGRGVQDTIVNSNLQVFPGFHEDDWQVVEYAFVQVNPVPQNFYYFDAQLGLSSEGPNTLFDVRIRHAGGATICQSSIFCPQANRVQGITLCRIRQAPPDWDESLMYHFNLEVRANNDFTFRVNGPSLTTAMTLVDLGRWEWQTI